MEVKELDLKHKITIPFAETGDKFNIPDTSPTGLVNNTDGFGIKYETPIADGGEYFERQQLNAIFYSVYAAVKELQEIAETAGFPVDMTKALNVLNIENGGTGANNATNARANLELGNLAVLDTVNTESIDDGAVTQSKLASSVIGNLPIGFIYFQLRGQATPDELFGTSGTWQDVSSEYAGEFFRAVGGNSASFGTTQAEGLPNITGGVAAGTGVYQNGFSAFQIGNEVQFSVSQQEGVGKANLNIDASLSNSIYGASTHVTPYNSAIRIWKKIA